MSAKISKIFALSLSMMFLVSLGAAYTNWDSGEPTDSGSGEDCAIMSNSGAWSDQACTDNFRGICEMPDGTYQRTSSSMAWADARSRCQDIGGKIVKIDGSSEQSTVESSVGQGWIGYYQKSSGSEPGGGWVWAKEEFSLRNLDSEVVTADGSGEFVMGRRMITNFSYDAFKPEPDPVQVSFVIDDTGSMGGQIDGIKDNVRSFFNELGENARGSIVTFKDSPEVDQYFTTDEGSLENTLSGISASGGGDAQEDASGGLDTSMNTLSWNEGRRKVIILVLGAGAHNCNRIENLADDMKDRNIVAYSVTDDLSSGCADSVHNYLPDTTGGQNYRFGTSWDKILEDIRKDTQVSSQADLYMELPEHALVPDGYDERRDQGPNTDMYIKRGVAVSDGFQWQQIDWYPTVRGSGTLMKTGGSYVNVTINGNTTLYKFNGEVSDEVRYVDLSVEDTSINRSGDQIDIGYNLANKGNTASKPRDIEIYDEDANSITRTIPSIPAGGSFSEVFTVGANHEIFQDVERISAHFDYQGFFSTVGVGEGQILEPDEENNKKLMGYPPRLQSKSPDSVQWNDTFRFSLDFGHYFSDMVQGNYSVYEDGTLIRDNVSYNKPAEGTLRTGYIDNDKSRIWYNITSYIKGPAGAISVYNHSYYVRNPRPEIYASEPKNLNPVYDEPVQLRAYVDDKNNIENLNNLDVKIYNQETGNLLKEETGVPPRSSVTYEWPDADKAGKVYRWNVTVSDRWHTISEVFRFRKSTRNSYRAETQSDYSYSAVVTSAGSPGNFEYTVNNPLDFDKNNMETSLSGVNASFADGSDTKSYSLPSKSSKTFDIVVSPDQSSTGQQYLTVTTENLNLGINNTDRIPVYVREDAKRSYGVPGLGLGQLLIIMLSSVALFYRKV